MPFGLRTWLGPRNHVLDGDPDIPWEGAILRGERGIPLYKGHSVVICAKTAEPIEMQFGLWDWMDPRNHVLDGVQFPPIGRGNSGGKGCP